MSHNVDPSLLEDPEWQAALAAAESPLPRRPHQRRESPSERVGASTESYDSYLASGGLSSVHETPFVVDLDRSDHNLEEGGSARTTPSNRPPRTPTRNGSRVSPNFRPNQLIHADDDDEISIISPPRSSALSSTGRPNHRNNGPRSNGHPGPQPRQPAATAPSPPQVIDLDHQYALQLQRELDGHHLDDVILEIFDDDDEILSDFAPHGNRGFGTAPSASSMRRQAAPAGPARGSFGVISRHGPPPPAHEPSTNSSRPNTAGSHSTSRRTAELPTYARTPMSSFSPAHLPSHPYLTSGFDASLPHRPESRHSAQSRASHSTTANRGRGNQNTRPSSISMSLLDEDEASFFIDAVNDDDDDELRLRTGVATRRNHSAPTIRTPHVPQAAIDQALASSGGRRAAHNRSQVDQDRELAAALQQGYGDVGGNPPARGRRGRGGRGRNQLGGRFGEFEVDTNDYEAMLRLSEQAPPVKRGASSAAINSLPVVRGNNDDCTICQGTAETAMIALPCLHNFHRECILPHLKTNRFCPNCRHELE